MPTGCLKRLVSEGSMYNQYVGTVPCTFQILYVCVSFAKRLKRYIFV